MDALEVGQLRLVSGFHQGVEAGLHQVADTAAKDSLLAEQVGLGLLFEGGLEHSGHRRPDAPGVGQRPGARLAGGVLVDREQRRHADPFLEHPPDDVAGALGGHHGDIHLVARHDLAEVNVEAVGEHQGAARLQVRLDRLVVEPLLGLVRHQQHDDVAHLDRVLDRLDPQVFLLGRLPGLAALVEADHHVDPTVLQVERVRVALAAVADHGDPLSGER